MYATLFLILFQEMILAQQLLSAECDIITWNNINDPTLAVVLQANGRYLFCWCLTRD